ncbi:hypothetical protein AVEN_33640-1, partial [Araneus ventricosus]
ASDFVSLITGQQYSASIQYSTETLFKHRDVLVKSFPMLITKGKKFRCESKTCSFNDILQPITRKHFTMSPTRSS